MGSFRSIPKKLVLSSAFIALALGFATSSSRLQKAPITIADNNMVIALPKFMQIILAGGDRYLAANITTFRALVSNVSSSKDDRLSVQAKIQSDAAWLNPFHEDNYYLAAATLPWSGLVDQAQYILQSASEARSFDMLPPFFYAFNQYYFEHDPLGGSDWLKIAASHTNELDQKLALEKLAARWIEKSHDHHQALKMLEIMASQSKNKSIRENVLLRAERVRHLISLDEASSTYMKTYNTRPFSIDDLTKSGILKQLPRDPLGDGYILDQYGKAQFKSKAMK